MTVEYERITGLRLPHQVPDGTFTANKSGTVTIESDLLRGLLLDDDDRAQLFPNVPTELKSKSGSSTGASGSRRLMRQAADKELFVDSTEVSRRSLIRLSANWDKQDTPPELPAEIVEQTAARSRQLIERLTA